ncbi:MAG: HAD hydrolase-like protein [Microthrixaceae bacterium]
MIVIFDLDGTVWDSEPGIVASLEHTFGALELPVPARHVLASNVGPPLRSMLAGLGIAEASLDDAVVAYRHRYSSYGVFGATLYPGVVDLLDALRADGHRLATATSKGLDPTLVMLEHFGIADRFEHIGAASMDGRRVTKEAVLADTLAALRDRGDERCVLVGDRHYDVVGAAAHGIDCIGVTWGYGDAVELHEAGASAIVASVDDLLATLRQG